MIYICMYIYIQFNSLSLYIFLSDLCLSVYKATMGFFSVLDERALDLGRALPKKHVFFSAQCAH